MHLNRLAYSCLAHRRHLSQVWARHALPYLRTLSSTSNRRTDGVFRELTAMRVRKPWVEALREREQHGEPKHSGQPESPTDRDLSPKKMADSYHSVILPLARDPWLLDTYLNATGHIRLGTIFMDLDALAGVIAYKHTGEGVSTVTASFDRITVAQNLTEICDLQLSGQVTYASGRSSMEITLQVARAPGPGESVKKEDVMIICQCTMVSLDPGTKKPVNNAPIRTDTDEEKRLYKQGEESSTRRKELARRSLLKTTPNDEESDLIHAMWQRQIRYHDPNDSLRKPDNVVYMDATRISTTTIMQPQYVLATFYGWTWLTLSRYRNRHHFMVFGGYLLKSTFELAFCCAASFAHSRPAFVSLDPSTFQNPVPVGSVLYLTATVVYCDPPLVPSHDEPSGGAKTSRGTRVQVRVDSKVRNVEHGETKPTGQFNYTFTVDKDIKVMPKTYTEFMMYCDGIRRARNVLESMKTLEYSPDGSTEGITE